jgi:glucuronide carrier protein
VTDRPNDASVIARTARDAIGGYIAASATNPSPIQPASAILAIKATIGLLPALAALITMIIFIKYPLNDQRFKQIRDETEACKRTVIKVHHEDPKILVTSNYAG